ncbi:excinuclease ABC subunit UvrC [Usitatibacter palustris]|uniref:UvrABC system protein C n=1 Tax=Usitatibacter palustris TaxID=2732487 RepID=A0A6M4HBE7_9PROT|nr:excinuclease ABC subunit UvrC [Usitatibacter palustris]QJR15297.1 UvrABC system protein C [Usitatibacter palustris]
MSAAFDSAAFVATLPTLPGIYKFFNATGDLIYVGKAKDLKKRVSTYFQKAHPSPRTTLMVAQIGAAEFSTTRTEADALLLENNLIKSQHPRYNVLFRDDKSYGYILVTGHRYPQIRFYRGVQQKGNSYFGPFPSSWAVRETIGHLQKIFRLRTCDDSVFSHRSRPCLLYQIHRCSGPCVGLIEEGAYKHDVEQARQFLEGKDEVVTSDLMRKMDTAAVELRYEDAAQYRDRIQMLQRIRSGQAVESAGAGDVDIVAAVESQGVWCVALAMVRAGRHLGDRCFFPVNASGSDAASVVEAFLTQHYVQQPVPARIVADTLELEDAAALEEMLAALSEHAVKVISRPIGESRLWVETARHNAAIALAARLAAQATQEARGLALQEFMGADAPIARIECFDISHTMGEAPIASCVVYEKGAMQTSEYRRYNVKDVEPGDDYGAMRYALNVRYRPLAEGQGKVPDLILIDGGKGQLSAARGVMVELGLSDIPMMGVAKGEERKPGLEQLFIAGEEEARRLPPEHPALHLIQQIRDEAHRFAITGHRAKRGKARRASTLEEIDAVGPKRRQQLLAHFGGLQGVMAAGVEDLARVEGISRKLAERIYNALH